MTGTSLPSNLTARLAPAGRRARQLLARRLAIDLRALAASRIGIAALLLADLARRSRNLVAFHTDRGVLPREALFSDYAGVYSVHAAAGEAWAQAFLFLLAGVVAAALLVGYRTWLATALSWLLLVSLHIRNPMVLNGGDILLRLLLFWGLFLPLGARWSVDARRRGRSRFSGTTVASVASAAILVQVLLMYVTNAVHKARGDPWMSGEAVAAIYSAEQFTVLLGPVVAEYHALLEVATHAWLALLVGAPLLLLLAGWLRAAFASLFVGAHLGMAVTMRIDLFPLIAVVALLLFYPPVVWDRATALASRLGERALPRPGRFDRLGALAAGPVIADGSGSRLPDRLARIAGSQYLRILRSTVVPGIFLVLVVSTNVAAVTDAEMPDPAEQVLESTETDQSWRLFAPNPASTTRWYLAPGRLANGSRVDVFHESRIDRTRPADAANMYPTARWRKYLSNVRSTGNTNHRSYLANYLCTRWNERHETELESVTIAYRYDSSDPYSDPEPVRERTLITYDCDGDLVQEPA